MKPLSANDPPVIGEFRLRARLGSGGMGRVYLGFSRAGRPVAVKVVHPHLADDPEFTERFRREVEAASKVSGMYAAAVVASGVTDDPPWLATAYVPGPSLATLITRYGPLPEEAAGRLAAGLAEALRAVHTAGLVHRDLKPANVLIADDGPHVIDFGISRALQGTQLTLAGFLVGTPGYMSPEQQEGTPATLASDVFALGCVLAYAATGQPPFGTGSSVFYRVATAEPDLSPVSPRLRHVIEACLRKDPAQRPSLAELADMIALAQPAADPTLGSFWPEPVARQIAAAQAGEAPGDSPSGPGHTNEVVTPAGAGAVAGAVDTPAPAAGPSGPAPLPAQREPAASAVPDVPWTVRQAVRLMYLGLAVTLANLILSFLVFTGYHATAEQPVATPGEHTAQQMAIVIIIALAADLVGLAAWAWLAAVCRRGAGWGRAAGTALLAIYSACALIVLLATHNDPGPRFATIAVWVIGLLAASALWSPSASSFFSRPRAG